MKNKKPVPITVRAWIADPVTAKLTEVSTLDALQDRFQQRLAVIHLTDGGMMIRPDCAGDQTAFDAFMGAYTALTPQMVNLPA